MKKKKKKIKYLDMIPLLAKMPNQRLSYIRFVKRDKGRKSRSLYQCKCGIVKEYDDYSVFKGLTKSCGCFNTDMRKARSDEIVRRREKGEDKILIYEFYSKKSKHLGRKKWVTSKELDQIYAGVLPDPFSDSANA